MVFYLNEKILKLLNQYLEASKIIYSAVEARQITIFEEQLEVRKLILIEIESNYSENSDKGMFRDTMQEIKMIESKIEIEAEKMRKEILDKQIENKLKMNSLKKSNLISNKYKYGSVETHQSTYIDNKK